MLYPVFGRSVAGAGVEPANVRLWASWATDARPRCGEGVPGQGCLIYIP